MSTNGGTVSIVYEGKVYTFPEDLEERFTHLTGRIGYAKSNTDYIEMYRGLNVVFNGEFSQYIEKKKKK